MSDRRGTRKWLRLVPAVAVASLIMSSTGTARTTGSTTTETNPAKFVMPKPHKVPRTSRRESRAVVTCLRRAHLKPVVTSGPGFLWEGWIAKIGGFVYAEYYPTLKEARFQAREMRLEESGLAHQIVISEHVSPYAGSPVPKVVRCLHGQMITKQPKKSPGHFHF